MKYSNINWSIILAPFSLYLAFVLVSYQVNLIWLMTIFLLLINLLNIYLFPGIKTLNASRFYLAYISALFSVSIFTYSTLMSNRSTAHFLIILGLIILYHYLKLVNKKLSPKKILDSVLHLLKQKTFNFAYIGVSLYINILAVFFSTASLYALKSFLNLSWYLIIVLMAFVVFPSVLALANALGLYTEKRIWLSLAWGLFTISLSLLFLPLSYYLVALIFVLIYYFAVNYLRFSLSNSLDLKRKKWYLLFPFLTIILILLSSNWL